MATFTFTLTIFNKSFNSVLGTTAHFQENALTLALLDQASAITEDTSDSGDEFLSDLVGYNILAELALPSATITNRLIDFDDSGASEMPDVGSGNTADKILLYCNSGVASTSRLVGIATLSAPISGDDNNDDLQAASGLIQFGS